MQLQNLEEEMKNDRGYQFQLNKAGIFKEYYAKVFPFNKIFKWLCYDQVNKAETKALGSKGGDYFNRREISYMVVSSSTKEEFCIRHECYKSPVEFREAVLKTNPIRIDIGPVCDILPSKAKDNSVKKKPYAVEREFIIDIDMDDYDNIRTCCKGKKMCDSCWQYLTSAYEVLKKTLEGDFGFKHIMWIFSGRRGIHAWVCDERARIMEDNVRKGVAQYMNISVGTEKSDSLVINAVHSKQGYPLFERSYQILAKKFENFIVGEQAFFIYKKNINKVMSVLERLAKREKSTKGSINLIEKLQEKLIKLVTKRLPNFNENISRSPTGPNSEQESELSREVFEMIKNFFELNTSFSTIENKFMKEIVIGLMYPKIDFNVSASTNHLLKCPFNIHSGTGLLSVPIDDFDTFKLGEVPYAQDVIEYCKENGNAAHPKFLRYLNFFEKFCDDLVKKEVMFAKRIEKGRMDVEREEVMITDF